LKNKAFQPDFFGHSAEKGTKLGQFFTQQCVRYQNLALVGIFMPHPPSLSPHPLHGWGKVGPGQGDEIDKLVGGRGRGIRRVRWNCTECQSPLKLVQNGVCCK